MNETIMKRAGLLLCLIGWGPLVQADPLTVSYVEKPPYYYTENNETKGFLFSFTQKMFEKAGVTVLYSSRPAKRILAEIESNAMQTCSIGWFKNPERSVFAKFSDPIYQDKPMVVLTMLNQEASLQKQGSLRELLQNTTLRGGLTSGFSYGTYIDGLLRSAGSHIEHTGTSSIANLKKLSLGRIDYTIVDSDELDYLVQQANVVRSQLRVVNYADIPHGNMRYVMCSKKVEDELIGRLNSAIHALENNEK